MAVTRLSNSGIKTGILKYDSSLAGYPGVMPAPTAADAGTGSSATVSFTAVSGATGYRAISTPGSFTGTGTSSPVTVSGLTAGTAYTFQIQAQNSIGYGGLSAASNSVTPLVPSAFEQIGTTKLTNNTTPTVTFNSIPQTYKHLQLRVGAGSTTDGVYYIRFNGTSGGFMNVAFYGGGSSNGQFRNTNETNLGQFRSAPNTDLLGPTVLDIFDYTNANKKPSFHWFTGYNLIGSGISMVQGGGWNSTNAITSIEIYIGTTVGGSGNYETGSIFSLYGIKGS